MQTINVNGKSVHTDKTIKNIQGNIITFLDGSYANVKTAEIVNRGSGIISFSEPIPDNRDKTKALDEVFDGITKLHLEELPTGFLHIELSDDSRTYLNIKGDPSLVESVEIQQSGSCLHIHCDEANEMGNISIRNGSISVGNISGSAICVGGGTVTVNGMTISGNTTVFSSDNNPNLQISLKIPMSTSLNFHNVNCDSVVEDIDGNVTIHSQTGADYQFGKVKALTYNGQGSSDIEIDEITGGDIKISSQGSGDVEIETGTAQNIYLNRQGSGDFKFGGTAINASGSLMGSGSVRIKNVQNPHNISIVGSGKIKIK